MGLLAIRPASDTTEAANSSKPHRAPLLRPRHVQWSAFSTSVHGAPAPLLRRHSIASGQGSCHRRACCVEAKIREIFMPVLSSIMTEGKSYLGPPLRRPHRFLVVVLVPASEFVPVGSAIALLAESKEEILIRRRAAIVADIYEDGSWNIRFIRSLIEDEIEQ
ncbi:hypothetical protein GUJ93_ZPchr0011g28623 [Zizania palustris]|uniref:Uncharacterized protein n=1 Tax=Zizania palustris TaxID=103762 RepID=A0A8J5WKW2_ZIZPA|nr:hypothetical protein GUJ93_ZPchr0011g28623 [Zizania palustris]